jgi:predicted nucleic acid-binding protein
VSRIVCNSGPLIALGILAQLDILKALFDEIFVPESIVEMALREVGEN